jgi:hypothetical protein
VNLQTAFFDGDSYNINSMELLYRFRISREIISEETDTAVQVLQIRKSTAYLPNREIADRIMLRFPVIAARGERSYQKSEKNKKSVVTNQGLGEAR